jgi:hypothetical protein
MFAEKDWVSYECRRCHRPVLYKQAIANDGTHYDCQDPWQFDHRQAQIDQQQKELNEDMARANWLKPDPK